MKPIHRSAAGLLGAALLASGAGAGTTTIQYTAIEQGTGSGFGFSLIHTPTDANGNGSLLYRMISSMTIVLDDIAGEITFTQFGGDLFEESDFNPNTLGALAGTIALRESSTLELQIGDDNNTDLTSTFVEGTLKLTISIIGEADRAVDIEFKAINYNALANRFDPNAPFGIGLWGATPEVFDGAITGSSLGFDLFANGGAVIVPLPGAANLGLLGMGLVGAGASRRRRR